MPCYTILDGIKQEMDDEVFDEMVEALYHPRTPNNTPTNNIRWRPDGTYDKKPLNPNYFKDYYQKNLKTPIACPDCEKMIRNRTNLSKHQKTNICIRNRI